MYEKNTFYKRIIKLDGNTLLYGNLYITVPDGVTVEQQEPNGEAVVIDLLGAESVKNLPHYCGSNLWYQ